MTVFKIVLYLPAQFKSVHYGHHHITDYQVDHFLAQGCQGFLPVERAQDGARPAVSIVANGTVAGAAAGIWSYAAPWPQVTWSSGVVDKVFVQRGRDWENKKNTIIFTGLDNTGMAVWGKKK